MVQLVEITGVLNEKGCIEIPIVLLAQTGIRTGEEVNLIYLAAGEKDYRNESREFMLKESRGKSIGGAAEWGNGVETAATVACRCTHPLGCRLGYCLLG